MKRGWVLLLSVFMIFAVRCAAAASAQVTSAPLKTVAAARNGMVRVWLSSLGSPTELTVTVKGSYSLDGRSDMELKNGQKLSVGFNAQTGSITLTANGKKTDIGQELILKRHQTTGTNGLLIAETKMNTQVYPGDLRLIAQKSGDSWRLYPIVSVYIENYLYGVLPYEMGASAPLEALKAQAVSARTYTLRRMNERASKIYDVVDTTNDQVYYGTPASSSQCVKAVDATKGIVLTYGGNLINAYYSSSNGGQTESGKNYWGTNEAYLPVKEDPFDLMSTSAVVRSLKILKDFDSPSQNKALSDLLSRKAGGKVIASIDAVSLTTPKYPEPSRLYTRCEITVRYTTGKQAVFRFDIFKELEAALGLSINAAQNELWSVEEDKDSFTVRARRFGHGIGMSQMGAMQMARLGYPYDKIIGFYYPGVDRSRYTMTQSILSSVGKSDQSVIVTEEEPAVITDTVTDLIDPDEYAALAAGSAIVSVPDKTTLNLRKKASKSGKLLCRIPHGSAVKIKNRGATWCQVEWNGRSGYVMTKYLTFPSGQTADTEEPGIPETTVPQTTEPAVGGSGTAVVIGGTLNLRQTESKKGKLLAKMKSGSTVQVTSWGKEWCAVTFQKKNGYAMTKYLKAKDITAAVKAAATVPEAGRMTGSGPDPEQETAAVPEQPENTTEWPEEADGSAEPAQTEETVSPEQPEETEDKVRPAQTEEATTQPEETENTVPSAQTQETAAVPEIQEDEDGINAPEEPAKNPDREPEPVLPEMEAVDLMAAVIAGLEGLPLLKECREEAEEITRLKPGALIRVTGFSEKWCHVQTDDADGYCLREFVLCN